MTRWLGPEAAVLLSDHCRWPGARAWVEGIDGALDEVAARWGVRLERRLEGGCGGVAAVVRRGGERLVVKATCPPADGAAEAAGLGALGEVGAAPALVAAHDGPAGGLGRAAVLLCALVDPGRPLGGVLRPAVLPAGVDGLLAALGRADDGYARRDGALLGFTEVHAPWTVLDGPRRARLAAAGWDPDEVQARTDALVAACGGGSTGAVHGDLHPGNLLDAGGTVVAVDPRPAVGDPAFDVGYLAVTATCGEPPDALLVRLSAARGCDPGAARSWAAAVAPALYASALAWPWGRERQVADLGRFTARR